MWRVVHINYYDDLFAEIEVAKLEALTDEEAAASCKDTTITLKQDHISVLSGNKEIVIKDSDRDKYSFEIVTKVTPPPVDPRLLSAKDKLDLLFNPDYMLEEDDFEKVPWTISEAFLNLKNINPEKTEFVLSSSAYRVEAVSEDGLSPDEKEAIIESLQFRILTFEEQIRTAELQGNELERTKLLLHHCESAYRKVSK